MGNKKVVITGINGFIGKNLHVYLSKISGIEILGITKNDDKASIEEKIKCAEIVYHLAGENKPKSISDFETNNIRFTQIILEAIQNSDSVSKLIFSSTIQAGLDNPYGNSKLEAENLIKIFNSSNNFEAIIYRLPNVFGKWGRPNYNSVVSTFCYNTAKNIPLKIHNEDNKLTLVYIDEVVIEFSKYLRAELNKGIQYKEVIPSYETTVGELASLISSFPHIRKSQMIPDLGNELTKKLYSTFLSYLQPNDFSLSVPVNSDERGRLFEVIKSKNFGQIFISYTKPGVTRGNHFHHTKTEKFCVIKGKGVIRFRSLDTNESIEYPVSGDNPQIVDIPPGYTHNISNVGDTEMITLFWADELFDKKKPDTYPEEV